MGSGVNRLILGHCVPIHHRFGVEIVGEGDFGVVAGWDWEGIVDLGKGCGCWTMGFVRRMIGIDLGWVDEKWGGSGSVEGEGAGRSGGGGRGMGVDGVMGGEGEG